MLTDEENRQRLQNHLSRYFEANYSGKNFEWFISQSERNSFTPWDILAVESLSVTVPVNTSRWLLEPNSKRDELIAESRRQLVANKDLLWTCDEELIREGGALSELYDLLRKMDGLGYVTTSKLMAAKFPSVIPIRDSKVETILGLENSREWWVPIRNHFRLSNGALAKHLDGFEIPDGVGPVSTLRRLDVILWMESKARDIATNKGK